MLVYLGTSILLQLTLAYVFYGFYQRRVSREYTFLNPSAIEGTSERQYIIIFVLIGLAVIVFGLLIWGILKNNLVAKIFFALTFVGQAGATVIAGLIIKDIEGIYFAKSSYAQNYFYFAWTLAAISLIVVIGFAVWLIKYAKKDSVSKASSDDNAKPQKPKLSRQEKDRQKELEIIKKHKES
ncbi:MAG: hypothetical protein AAFX87_04775 [Bacteroidota bacterium]